jgi:pimeloyl-ACP methyl ester carboxylesterase
MSHRIAGKWLSMDHFMDCNGACYERSATYRHAQWQSRQWRSFPRTHDMEEAFANLSPEGIAFIRRFYQGHSARAGALNDATHTVGENLLQAITTPTLVIHSREDKSVPFQHAEWSLQHISGAVLCESGCTGHFIAVDPEYPDILARMSSLLKSGCLPSKAT